MNILMISVHGDPLLPLGAEEAGGQNVYVREVARALASRGHQVDVFTRGRHCRTPEVHPAGPGIRVIRLPAGPVGFISRNHLFHHLPEWLGHLEAFVRADRRHFDVVHSNYWLSGACGLRIAAAWRIPQVHTHHSLGAVKYQAEGRVPPLGFVRIEQEEAILRAAAAVVATSPQEVANFRRHYASQGRVRVIPCGVDDRIFRPRDRVRAREALGLSRFGPVIGYVGRFTRTKGIDELLHAAPLLHERAHLLFAGGFDPAAGDRSDYDRVVALAEELGVSDRCTFLGRLRQEELAIVYSAADLCAVPSHYESFGMVAIEAMGCGTPVVASRVGGLQYAVEDERTGLLVPPRSPETLARACDRLLADEALRRGFGQRGAIRVQQQFTWGAVAQQLETLYAGLCSQGDRTVVRA